MFFAKFLNVDLMEVQKYWDVFISDSEKFKNVSGPVNFVRNNIFEEFFYMLYSLLSWLIKNLSNVYIARLATCRYIFFSWKHLALIFQFINNLLIDLRVILIFLFDAILIENIIRCIWMKNNITWVYFLATTFFFKARLYYVRVSLIVIQNLFL